MPIDQSSSRTPTPGQPVGHSYGRRWVLARVALGLWLAGVLVIGGIGFDRTVLMAGSTAGDAADASRQFALIRDVWNLLHQDYVGRSSLDDTKLAYAANAALADAVDDPGHTDFETPGEVASEQAVLSGHYVGIGIELDQGQIGPIVRATLPGGPAALAGLVAGDVIVAIDGQPIAGLSLSTLVVRLAGPAGSSVTLTVEPSGGALRRVTVTRREVSIPDVEWAPLPGTHLAMVRIDQFSAGTTAKLVSAIHAARSAGARGIVLDLRGDPGGLTSEAVGVTSQFIESGAVYRTRDAAGDEAAISVEPGGVALTGPLAVLVDHGTASSAEIVAGALKDAGRATLVGETTFGTGTILGQYPLPDGSALRVGTKEWLTRAGRQIWHRGLTPDVVVQLDRQGDLLTPSALRALGTRQLAESGDAQLLAGIRLLGAVPGNSGAMR